ncbi:MAG: outer membrane lipoprotein-sorting protein [Helicobacteraceae bacterium]|jgi:outer membrane lipoprotein-sorting protein|nr:outer membrane lipoprotein-sorting protein [Helicobacteraceae bacterium]
MKKLFFLLIAAAIASGNEAYEIMKKADARDKGDLMSAETRMILIDAQNRERSRKMRQFKKIEGETTKRAIFFAEPVDVKDTSFLTFDHRNKDDDQWLYLPSLRKTKRVAAADQSGSFMGSDFSYNDLTDRNLDDYDYALQGEREANGALCYVIEATPKNEKVIETTGYVKSLLLVRKDNFVIVRSVNYERKNGRAKFMDIPKLAKIDGVWQPLEMKMTTRQDKTTLHSTILYFDDVKFGRKLNDEIFTIRGIEKGI